MALRILSATLALALLITAGCRTSSRYQPQCCGPAVVATAPVAPACPQPCAQQVPPPAPIVVPR